ncbi:hypothetical protein L596_020264 [Steinernema carpocapsae]|uniref:G-protein coupled receptors family 1 profile domain-containing protein n=1 Tax=Steinernema carpocapsae TaxID=34508 RepID=A0A4U5MT80_STECR|nr:hypothetical protein L596_020264 [Steinernema carpocapsae]
MAFNTSFLPFCDEFGNLTINPDKPERGILIGVTYLCVAAVSIPMSSFIFCVFSTPALFKLSCYKLLVFTILADILNLTNAAFLSGFASIMQISFCNEYYWYFYYQFWGLGLWYYYCISSMVLAFNRMLNFANHRLSEILFGGCKPWFWLVFMIAYCCFGLWISPTIEIYIPNVGVFIDGIPCYFHIYQNFFKIGTVTTCYVVMLINLRRMKNTIGLADNTQIPVG